jgi:hypothetical protein
MLLDVQALKILRCIPHKVIEKLGMHNFVARSEALCRNPNLVKCGGEAQHLEKWGFGVLRNSRMFRARQQGAKHLALGCSWCHWKGLET